MTLPTGTPIEFENLNYAETISLFVLAPASGEQVANGACIVPGALRTLPGPGASAYFIFVEWPWGNTGVRFEAETVGEVFDHDSALDPTSTVDATKLGLATCDADPSLLVSSSGPSGGQAVAGGTLTSQNGCLTVSGYDSPLFVVWPNGYSLAEEGDDVWLVDDSGNRIAKIGDYVLMDGESRDLAHAESEVVGGIPPSCQVVGGPDAYWFAGTPELVEPQPTTPSPACTFLDPDCPDHTFLVDLLERSGFTMVGDTGSALLAERGTLLVSAFVADPELPASAEPNDTIAGTVVTRYDEDTVYWTTPSGRQVVISVQTRNGRLDDATIVDLVEAASRN